jgi:hypothetical protein
MELNDTGAGAKPYAAGQLPVQAGEVEAQQGGIFSGAPGFLTTKLDAVVNWSR